MTIKSRLAALEAKRGGDTAILVTHDDQSYHLCGTDRVLTRAEVDALLGDVTIVRVVRASQVAEAGTP